MSNKLFQSIASERQWDRFGGQWLVPAEARRKRSDFEIALASQLQPSKEEQAVYGMKDHYGLSEHEKEVGVRKVFRTADEDVGFSKRRYGPPGLAEPMLVSNSAGNHRYHSYDGAWRHGRMHGEGVYRFADDTEYKGNWIDGKREGDVDVSTFREKVKNRERAIDARIVELNHSNTYEWNRNV